MQNDADLLRRYAEEQSESAFAELVQRHLGLVYGAALRQLGGAVHRAEDVTQTVFVDLARHARSLSRRTEIGGWLYTSTHYAAAKLKRGEERRQAREQKAQLMHEISSRPTTDTAWEQLRPVLDEAMLALPESDREAILMRYFQSRRFADVGQRLGLSEDAARMRVERALEKLRALLARRGIGSKTAALSAALASQTIVAAPAGLAASITGTALAGGGAMVVSSTGFFMSTSFVIASAIALSAVGVTVYQTKQARSAEAALVRISHERDSLNAQLRQGQQRVVQAEQRYAALEGELAAVRANKSVNALPATSPATPAARGTAMATRQDEEKNALEQVKEKIELRRELRSSRSVVEVKGLETAYRALYRQLNFSPEQTAQFKALAIENATRHEELDKLAAERGMLVKDPAIMPLYGLADAEFNAKFGAAFGGAALQVLQHYAETLPLRPWVEQVASSLFYTDAPLNARQADQLVEILSSNLRNPSGAIDAAAMNGDAILAQAQALLSPTQLPPFRALVAKFAAEGENARKRAATAGSTPAR